MPCVHWYKASLLQSALIRADNNNNNILTVLPIRIQFWLCKQLITDACTSLHCHTLWWSCSDCGCGWFAMSCSTDFRALFAAATHLSNAYQPCITCGLIVYQQSFTITRFIIFRSSNVHFLKVKSPDIYLPPLTGKPKTAVVYNSKWHID